MLELAPQGFREHQGYVILAAAGDERLRFDKLVSQIVTITCRHASCNDERGTCCDVGKSRHIEDGFEALLGGALNERAGVHHYSVGTGRIVLDHESCTDKLRAHVFRIHLVLCASERDERDARRFGCRIR